MKTETSDCPDDLRPEYDLKELLKGGVRGRYADRYRGGTNLVLLEPDVARAFPDDAAVNRALRLVIEIAGLGVRAEEKKEPSPAAAPSLDEPGTEG